METSDDPISAILIGGAVFGGMAAGGAFSGEESKMPSMEASQPTTTAQPTGQESLSEREKRSRRLAASYLTKDWGQPTLGRASLIGI